MTCLSCQPRPVDLLSLKEAATSAFSQTFYLPSEKRKVKRLTLFESGHFLLYTKATRKSSLKSKKEKKV